MILNLEWWALVLTYAVCAVILLALLVAVVSLDLGKWWLRRSHHRQVWGPGRHVAR